MGIRPEDLAHGYDNVVIDPDYDIEAHFDAPRFAARTSGGGSAQELPTWLAEMRDPGRRNAAAAAHHGNLADAAWQRGDYLEWLRNAVGRNMAQAQADWRYMPAFGGVATGVRANWKSVRTFQHTFTKHGEGAKVTRSLTDTARSTGKPQGQWLDNDAAAQLLQSHRGALDGPASIRIPTGRGQVIMPDGTTVGATRATLVPGPNGYVTGYPIP